MIDRNRVLREAGYRAPPPTARAEAERRYQELVERLPDGVFQTTTDGRFVEANRAMVEMLGYENKSDLLKLDILRDVYVRPSDRRRVRESLHKGAVVEVELRRKDGSHIWVEERGAAVADDSGSVLYYQGILRDVTLRREAEAALRAADRRLRDFVERTPMAIWEIALDGTFLSANPAALHMLGYESEKDLFDVGLVGGVVEDVEALRDGLARLERSPLGEDFEIWARRADGASILLRGKGRLAHDVMSDERFVELVAEDITERRHLEDALRHAQKMEAVGQLTGGIAHDFNNLLSIILLNAELILSEKDLELAPSAVEYLGEIAEAGRRAAVMTRQLLGFSRKAQLTMKPTSLAEVVAGLSSMMSRLLPASIELKVACEGSGRLVRADAGAVEQMVLNLVTNARDAMPDGGVLSIKVSERMVTEAYRREHSYARVGPHVTIAVSDNGSGMPPEVVSRVFEPFFTTKPEGKGTGLGLAMVYGLAKQHGGFVNVYSEAEEGTTITLSFPCEEGGAAEESASAPTEVHQTGGARVLLVEDEDVLRSAGRRVLESAGYVLADATDGEDALRILEADPDGFDLVVTDLIMPHMGGAELLRKLGEDWPDLRVMLVSGYGAPELFADGQLDASVPVLAKPWTVEELLGAVRRALL